MKYKMKPTGMLKPMRIAFITPDLFHGGAQQHIAMLCKHLDRQRYKPIVICLYSGGAFEKALKEVNVPAIHLVGEWVYWLGRKFFRKSEKMISPGMVVENGRGIRKLAFAVAEWLSALELPLILCLFRIQLISVHLLTIRPAIFAAKILRLPVVYTEHGVIDSFYYNNAQIELLTHWAPKANKVIAVSGATRDSMVDRLGLPADKINVIGHSPSFDLSATGIESKPMRIATLSRMVQFKGHDCFIDAVKILSVRFPELKIRIAGYGELRSQLEKKVDRLGLGKYVEFSGEFRNNDLPKILSDVSIVAVPSSSEALGIVALEAMACGVPVVASKTGGLSEIVQNGVTGMLVPPDDPYALAEALSRLLENQALRILMAKSAYEWAIQFTPDAITLKTSAIYDQLKSARSIRR